MTGLYGSHFQLLRRLCNGNARAVSNRIWRASSSASTPAPKSPDPRDCPLPIDGLPRYPNLTPLGLLRLLDYAGTVSFSYSGSLLAAASGMDLLGATIVGTITAVGGGTIRDAVILSKRPFWTSEPEYLYLSLAVACGTFCAVSPFGHEETPMEVAMDAAGVGAFCVIGAMNGIRAGVPALVTIVCGMSTATFGGAVRDVLCDRKVRILHSTAEIYATTAAFGAAAYAAARAAGAGLVPRLVAGVGLAVALRGWAWTEGVRLPVWRESPASRESPAPPGAPAAQTVIAQRASNDKSR